MTFSLQQAAEMMGAQPPAGKELHGAVVQGYSIDSRAIRPGELFFAVRGERRDGHEFIDAALSSGAIAAVASRGPAHCAARLLLAADPKLALQQFAAKARQSWGRKVIAITGSNGKTTTKEIVAALLSTRFRVAKSEGNLNNDLGLPLSLLRMDAAADLAVLELGMNHAGEIRALASIARPDIGVVTNVNAVHLEFFHSVGEIALAKRELIESLPASGIAVLNADDDRVSDFARFSAARVMTFGVGAPAAVRAVDVENCGLDGTSFRLQAGGEAFFTPLPGRHNLYNTLAGLAVAQALGIEPASLRDAVRALRPAHMRGELVEVGQVRILNDCYNSNPRAAEAMLELLSATPAARRVAVLGEMLELGPASQDLHCQLGRRAARSGLSLLVGVGGAARFLVKEAVRAGLPQGAAFFFDDSRAAGKFLATALRPGDVVLFKASRGVRLEEALDLAVTGCLARAAESALAAAPRFTPG
ncbi:MAG TPA: UDP-N-acetylmuramoyl-tripeptide--D-alanyl-D-alanine ligase [Bryobacterales bacterium]|nr:UDP-N-acetylmuramoyl-tripeptide--D-alanyl-D-alanine ligase [Bryobacterales bacterium]